MDERAEFQQEIREVDTYVSKCRGCGATMVFDPESQTLKCPHCGATGEIEKDFSVIENDIIKGFQDAEKWSPDEQVTYKCDNCGAVVVLSVDEEASTCPFCKTTHIAKEGSFKSIRPHMVIPFQFGTEKATEYSKKWAKSRIFAPHAFKKSIRIDNVQGVYEPCFTFDSNTYSTFYGRVGDRRTRTVGSGKNRRTETYIVYRNVSGAHDRFFDDVLIATNENFNQKELNRLSPYKTEAACVYESKYLSGFMAEGYHKNLDESWAEAKVEIEERIRRQIIDRLHCDVVEFLNVSTRHERVTFKYLLIPVYTLVYKFKGNKYTVRVNGSTGRVKGKCPVSPLRVVLGTVFGIAAAIGALWLLTLLL